MRNPKTAMASLKKQGGQLNFKPSQRFLKGFNLKLTPSNARTLPYKILVFPIVKQPCLHIGLQHENPLSFKRGSTSKLDFNIYAGWQIQFHQSINCFCRRLMNVDNSTVRASFKVFARIFVYVGRS